MRSSSSSSSFPDGGTFWRCFVLALLLAAGFQGLLSILASSGRAEVVVAATALALGAAAGGYALGSALLARHRVTVPRATIEPRDDAPDAGPTRAVVILAPIEPAEYRFATVAADFTDLADAGVALPHDVALPLFYAARRDSYRSIGTSDASAAAGRVARRLERLLLAEEGGPVVVAVALADAPPRLTEVVAELADGGVRRVVVLLLSAGASFKTDKALSELDASRPGAAGVVVSDATARWAACGIPELIAERVARVTHVARAEAGVVLVTEGRPEPWDRVQPQASHEETFIVQRVRALLAEAGYDLSRVVEAALEWRDPDVAEAAARLFDSGCPQVVAAPTTIPVDGTPTLVDLQARGQARGQAEGIRDDGAAGMG